MRTRAALTALLAVLAVLAVAAAGAALVGCGGQSGPPEKGLLVTGAGIRATQPPWAPEYTGLQRRITRLGIPTGDSEKFHIHALVSIYNKGILVPVPANLGIDLRHHVLSTIHTHDNTGVIHMEAPRQYPYTLADLFTVWGVRFGAGTLGALQDSGANRVWVYVNGRPITNPARYVMHNGDNIAIGYGTPSSFPHTPSTFVLHQVMAGKGGYSCNGAKGPKQKSCLAMTRGSKG